MKVNASLKKVKKRDGYVSTKLEPPTTIMDPVINLRKIPVLAVLEAGMWSMAAMPSSQLHG